MNGICSKNSNFDSVMKNRLVFILLILAAGCSKHKDPAFTSAEGKWTYTTPDSKMAVTFELVKNSSGGLDIENQTIKIDGTLYQSASQITRVNPPSILKIPVNSNAARKPYAFN